MKYFTLEKARNLVRVIPQNLSDKELQEHLVKLRDYKRYIDCSDMPRLISGGYFAAVVDPSASGLVPVDIWLHANLGHALDEALKEKQKRIESGVIK